MSQIIPAVRLIIPDESRMVLLVKRQMTSHGEGAWCLPGGKVDYGETVEQAAAKELREETSLELVSARFLFYQDSLPSNPGEMHCINLYFECEVSGTIELNEESSDYAWVDQSKLDDYNVVFRNDEALMRYWREKSS